jgi:hypothetical protein
MKITFDKTVLVSNNWILAGTPIELKSMKYTRGVLTHVSVLTDTKDTVEITLYPDYSFIIEL